MTYQSLSWGLRHDDQLSIVNQFKKAVTMIFKNSRKSIMIGKSGVSDVNDAMTSL